MPPTIPSLNAHEARLLGVLIEKSLTTPEQYPLSSNAATAGANQKSNRDPVVDYSEAEVHVALQGLMAKLLAGRVTPAGSRVEKYRHNAKEVLKLDDAGLAIVAELLMRGPQTQGELRGRASRMATLPTLEDAGRKLAELAERELVRSLEPAPGSRAERWVQLLAPDLHPLDRPAPAEPSATPRGASDLAERVAALEAAVVELRERLDRAGA
jgi:uncharacterized protein YceH (UPF0502 family)